MTATFAQVIKEVAHLCGAVEAEGTATSGTTTTLVDNANLGQSFFADNYFAGERVYVWKGTAIGQERIITANTGSSGTLTWVATGTAPDATSQYIILKRGWTVGQIKNAWLNAYRQRQIWLTVPKVDTSLTLTMGSSPVYSYNVPSGFIAIEHILMEDTVGSGDYLDEITQDEWYISKSATPAIVFDKAMNDHLGFLIDGARLKLIGRAYDTEPSADSDTISIPFGRLEILAAALGHMQRAPSDPQQLEQHMNLYKMLVAEYERIKGEDERPINPGSVLVEPAGV